MPIPSRGHYYAPTYNRFNYPHTSSTAASERPRYELQHGTTPTPTADQNPLQDSSYGGNDYKLREPVGVESFLVIIPTALKV